MGGGLSDNRRETGEKVLFLSFFLGGWMDGGFSICHRDGGMRIEIFRLDERKGGEEKKK